MSMVPIKLDLEECFQNGPPFQAHLLQNESYVLTSDNLLKSFGKTSRQAVEASESFSKATKAVAQAVEAIGKFESQHGEDPTGVIVQLSEIFKAIEFDRKEMNKNIENFVNEPLENHLKSDFIYLKELKKKFEKEKIEFGYAYSRYMSKKAKDIGVLESAQEVGNLRRELHETSLSLAIHLNEMIDKKSTFVYQSVSNYLNCRLEFAEREVKKLKEIKSHLDDLAAKKIVTPDEHKERLMKNFQRKNSLISVKPGNRTNGPSRSGYLYKRSSHSLRPVWSRRFFSLNGDKLIYYSMEGKGDQARVGIDLRLCHVQAVDDPERRFCFDLISPIRGYRLQAENENDLAGWLDAIKSGTILALQKSASSQSNPAKSISKEFGLTKETGHEDLIHSILSFNQIELALSAGRKDEIFAVDGNTVCADCRSENPDWASLSFGILICIKCSGIHRSLGVHLSKVRSLALDFWNPEHVELLKCIGNARSWDIFEETYDAEERKIERAEPDSSQQIKEKWIMAKYVNREFIKFHGNEEWSEEEKLEFIRTMLWDSIEKDDVVGCLRALALGASVDDTCELELESECKVSECKGSECKESECKGSDCKVSDCKGSKCKESIKDQLDESELLSTNVESSLKTDDTLVQSALQRAAQLKNWNLVALLLLWGADSEYRDSLGRNLVHYLAAIADSSISVLLSVLRKNPSLGGWEDFEGRTGLQYAEAAGNGPVATIIRVFQAQLDEESATSAKGPNSNFRGISELSGQDSPAMSDVPKTPTTAVPTSTTLSAALEKVLNFTHRGPFKRKSKQK